MQSNNKYLCETQVGVESVEPDYFYKREDVKGTVKVIKARIRMKGNNGAIKEIKVEDVIRFIDEEVGKRLI